MTSPDTVVIVDSGLAGVTAAGTVREAVDTQRRGRNG
jgi:hypothetical protein